MLIVPRLFCDWSDIVASIFKGLPHSFLTWDYRLSLRTLRQICITI
jgi:hypothetical protein